MKIKNLFDRENQILGLSIGRRFWSLIAGPVTIYFLTTSLTLDEQGYYYSFESILALKVFFELGLSFVIMQFVSHEVADVIVDRNGVSGCAKSIDRIGMILESSKRKYRKISCLLIIVVGTIGFFFFSEKEGGVNWQSSWFAVVFFTAINLYYIPHLAVLEGAGRRRSFYIKYLIDGVLGSLLMWGMWFFDLGLLAIAALPIISTVNSIIWINLVECSFFRSLKNTSKKGEKDLLDGVWEMQKKIALSWVAGYFMTKLFSPMLFQVEGPSVAGAYGLTMVVISNLYIVGVSIVSTKAPLFGNLISKKEYSKLGLVFKRSIAFAVSVYILGSLVLIGILVLLTVYFPEYRVRFLGGLCFWILILAVFANLIIASCQSLIRSFKVDPLVKINVLNGVLNASGGCLAVWLFGVFGLVVWYCLIQILVSVFLIKYTLSFYEREASERLFNNW